MCVGRGGEGYSYFRGRGLVGCVRCEGEGRRGSDGGRGKGVGRGNVRSHVCYAPGLGRLRSEGFGGRFVDILNKVWGILKLSSASSDVGVSLGEYSAARAGLGIIS